MNIHEINDTIQAVKEKFDDPESQVSVDVLKDTLDSLEATRNDKLDGLAGWYGSNDADIDWIDKQIKHYQTEKKRLTNLNDRIMKYMTTAIDEADVKQIRTQHHILRPRSYRASVYVDPKVALPDDYITKEVKEVEKVNKKLLYQDLKAGIKVPGAELVPNRKTTILQEVNYGR